MNTTDTIQFYSDFNCPFCYALNERLISMGDTQRIQWRGIEHEASATSAVVTPDEKNQILNEVAVVRKRASEITVHAPPFRPNTRLVNQVAYHLREQDPKLASQFRTRVYRALWIDGKDISNPDFLKSLTAEVGLEFPSAELLKQFPAELLEWQKEWEGDIYKTRLPVMFSSLNKKPLLGFPTYDLLRHFFAGTELPIAPESLAACQLKPKQNVLLVGEFDPARCNLVELEAAYILINRPSAAAAEQWLKEQDCAPDVILIDYPSLTSEGLALCSRLKREHSYRHTSVLILLDGLNDEQEMAAFDAGAADVLFDLSNPKVAQARLDAQLRSKQSAAILDALAHLDYLTELPNRREFDRKLEDEWHRGCRKNEPLSIIIMDIDHFKLYNDHYGHSMGDDCLRQTAKAMGNAVHRRSDLLARYGGEEFSVVLPDTDSDGASRVANAIREAVEACAIPHEDSSAAKVVTISLGIATTVPTLEMMPDKLLEAADEALYTAKQQGRNRAELHPALRQGVHCTALN
ncbi:diguanylate cyclase domain-containing protein [Aestuariirhabdus sp. LZHN29]|uniref:diguanylate cyclase domain-containing protein n=1 Tax=Aestuariirhabdus sp. LZHN29 TaxID=3417462 RepID=UPI003CF7CEFA